MHVGTSVIEQSALKITSPVSSPTMTHPRPLPQPHSDTWDLRLGQGEIFPLRSPFLCHSWHAPMSLSPLFTARCQRLPCLARCRASVHRKRKEAHQGLCFQLCCRFAEVSQRLQGLTGGSTDSCPATGPHCLPEAGLAHPPAWRSGSRAAEYPGKHVCFTDEWGAKLKHHPEREGEGVVQREQYRCEAEMGHLGKQLPQKQRKSGR